MQLAYSLEPSACPASGTFVLQLFLLDEQGKLLPAPPLTADTVAKWIRASDRPLLPWLTAQLRRSSIAPTSQPRQLAIEAAQLQATLRLLAATGKLFHREKRLTCDFFGRHIFIYQLSKRAEGWYVSGTIREGERTYPLPSCEAIRQGCYLRGGQLRFFTESVPWSHLSALYVQEFLPLDATLKTQLAELWKDTPASIHFASGTPQELWGPGDPLPLLALTDRTGAFANLMMDYGDNRCLPYHRQAAALRIERHKRNAAAEKQWEEDLLTTDYHWKPSGTSTFYCPVDKVPKSLTFLLELGWQIRDWQGNKVALCSATELFVRETGPQLIVQGSLRYGDHSASAAAAIGCFNRRERFVALGTGEVGLLPDHPTMGDLALLAADGELVGDSILLPRSRIGLLDALNVPTTTWELSPALKALWQQDATALLLSTTKVGAAFQGELRPYQQAGVDWLHFLYEAQLHGLLADDMGLGKTVQVLAFLSTLAAPLPHLIVVPTTLLHHWQAEIQRFLPSCTVFIHHGPERPTTQEGWRGASILLTSYALLRLDALLFQSTTFQCLILDEAHLIKNASTQAAQAACAISARFRLSMTGTPVENNLRELWSQFHFLLPGLLGKQELFSAEVGAGGHDPRFLQRIKRQVRPFVLRRTKQQVAPDLPPKIEQTVWVEMTPGQRQLYDTFLAGARSNLLQKVRLDGAKNHHFEILEILLRLRQICCHPLLAVAQHAAAEQVESAKFELLLTDLDTLAAEGAKVLIYSQFTTLLKLVAQALQQRDYRYCYLDGQTQERAAVVNAFQTDPTLPFFLISLKAGGVGLNLTAADYVLLLDPWWNEAAEQQAIDRAHRIGRVAPVIAKRYVTLDSIEEKIMRLKAQKRTLAQEIMGEETGALELTAHDFAWLLED